MDRLLLFSQLLLIGSAAFALLTALLLAHRGAPGATLGAIGLVGLVSGLGLWAGVDSPLVEGLLLDGGRVGAGEWWRIVSVGLVHGSGGHLLGNIVVLGAAGALLERLRGARALTGVLVVAIAGGSLAALAAGAGRLVGVSGGAYGVLGALVALLALDALRRRSGSLALAALGAGYALVRLFEASPPGGSLACHAGGALVGLLAGALLARSAGGSPSRRPAASGEGAILTRALAAPDELVSDAQSEEGR